MRNWLKVNAEAVFKSEWIGSRKFRYPEIALEIGIQGCIYVKLIIDEKGNITNIKLRGPDKNLEKEARVGSLKNYLK